MPPLPDLAPETLGVILAVYLAAGLVKGAMGFGLPLIAAVVLSFFQPLETALALNAVVILLTNLEQLRQAGAARAGLAAGWPLMLGMAAMVPVGAWFTAAISTAALMVVLGAFVLVFVAASFLHPALAIPAGWERRTGFGLGLVSGLIGAMTSSPGAIFVIHVVALRLARPVYMAALGAIMATFGLILSASYAAVGILRWEHAVLGIASAAAGAVGMRIGNRWARRLPAETFRRIVLVLLGVLGLVTIQRGLG